VILSKPEPMEPGMDLINQNLSSLWERIRNTPLDQTRRFYFYFSGHGFGFTSQDVGLCLAPWSKIMRFCALHAEAYLNLIKESGRFDEIFFFLDCCRVRIRGVRGIRPFVGWIRPEENAKNARYFTAYATQYLDPAYEAEIDQLEGAPEVSLERGFFTTALMTALRGNAASENGGVPLNALKDYLEKEVKSLASRHNKNQVPVIESDFPTDTEVILGSILPRKNVHISFDDKRNGHEIVLEGPDLEPIKQGQANGQIWDLTLSKGIHVLKDLQLEEEKIIRFEPTNEIQHVIF
ncbi:MAG: hypothetical protein DWQ02_18650, partial [Bacteroidetes bacterium]